MNRRLSFLLNSVTRQGRPVIRYALLICTILVSLSFLVPAVNPQIHHQVLQQTRSVFSNLYASQYVDYDPLWRSVDLGANESNILKYPHPHTSVTDQLLPNTRYVTHAGYGGHTNQFISMLKAFYYAKLTNRVYIAPSLYADHFGGPHQDLGYFYDYKRVMASTSVPIIDMSRVKVRPEPWEVDEKLACWSVMETVGGGAAGPRGLDEHGVGMHVWPLPPVDRAWQDIVYSSLVNWDRRNNEWWDWFEKVKRESLPQDPKKNNTDKSLNIKENFNPDAPRPNEQMMCFDATLFLYANEFPETFRRKIPEDSTIEAENLVWTEAGVHFHYSSVVDETVDQILYKVLGSTRKPFIGVHIRRGDFLNTGQIVNAVDPYFTAINKVREEIARRIQNPNGWNGPGKRNFNSHGMPASKWPILVTTDEEPGTDFYNELLRRGAKIVNHKKLQTETAFEGWGPTILDGALLSRASGFVGTHASTFSQMAGMRVKYWRGGPVQTVFP